LNYAFEFENNLKPLQEKTDNWIFRSNTNHYLDTLLTTSLWDNCCPTHTAIYI